MMRVALTGGIATGKSYCLEQFRRLGADVIDADTVARDVVAAGTTGFDAVVSRFGASILDASGAIDRAVLGHLVFKDATARLDLEAIVHPLVYERIETWFTALAEQSPSTVIAIADIPLLYETGHDDKFHTVIVASCPRELQIARLAQRGMSAEEAERRLAAQLPIQDKITRANYTIDTSGSMAETDQQVHEIWKALGARHYTFCMSSIADDLRAESRQLALALSMSQRIDRALALGDDDARLFAAARRLDLATARRELARTRHLGRQPSCAAAERR